MASFLFVAACAKPPALEISDAENAINAAVQAGAQEYAADQLKTAQDALADANAKVATKDYKNAKLSALDAKAKADAAAAAVEPSKQAVKADLDARMPAVKAAVEAADAAAAKLKGKGTETLKSDAAALNGEWAALQADYDGGKFKLAVDRLAELPAKAEALKAAADAAAPKAPVKKKK